MQLKGYPEVLYIQLQDTVCKNNPAQSLNLGGWVSKYVLLEMPVTKMMSKMNDH